MKKHAKCSTIWKLFLVLNLNVLLHLEHILLNEKLKLFNCLIILLNFAIINHSDLLIEVKVEAKFGRN